MDQQENIYSAKDAAALLNVKESTLRKYALILEEAGYKYYKNENGQRGFFDKDVIAVRRMLDINQNPDMTLKRAAHAVVTAMAKPNATVPVMSDVTPDERYMERYIEEVMGLKEAVAKQNKIMQKQGELIEQLLHQLEKERTENKQSQELLLEKLNQISTPEEPKSENPTAGKVDNQKNRSWWQRIFNTD